MEEILTLAMELCGMDKHSSLLESICHAAERFLQLRLRDDVVPVDCGRAYPLAVASIAAKAYNEGVSPRALESFSAGDLSIRMDSQSDRFVSATLNLMRPFLKDDTFSFLGV